MEDREQDDRSSHEICDGASHVGVGDTFTGCHRCEVDGPASAPAINEPAWHATNGDPQSKVHKADNHKVNEPYFVPKGKSGGAWFLWTEV